MGGRATIRGCSDVFFDGTSDSDEPDSTYTGEVIVPIALSRLDFFVVWPVSSSKGGLSSRLRFLQGLICGTP